jgi:hypothetical protein
VKSRKDCRVRVEGMYSKDKYGLRSTHRTMQITDRNNVAINHDNVLSMNVKSVCKDRGEATQRNRHVQK